MKHPITLVSPSDNVYKVSEDIGNLPKHVDEASKNVYEVSNGVIVASDIWC